MAPSPLDNKLVLGICGFLPVLPVLLIWKISPGHSSPAATGRVVWKRIIFDAPWYWTSTLAEGKGAWLIMSPKGKQTSGHVADIGQHAKTTACIIKFCYYWILLDKRFTSFYIKLPFSMVFHQPAACGRGAVTSASSFTPETAAEKDSNGPPKRSKVLLCNRTCAKAWNPKTMMFQWLIGSVCRIHAADRSYFEVYKEDSKERVDFHGPKELQDVWRNSISWFEFAASGFAFVLSSLCFKASVRQDLAQLFVPGRQLLG